MKLTNKEAFELLKKYQSSGDINTLGQLYAPYMEMVLAIGLKYYKDQHRAEDLVMVVFEKIKDKAKTHQISNFSSWLYSLAKNECLMALRKTKKEFSTDDFSFQKQVMENEQIFHLFEENKKEKQLNQLENCIEQLKPEQKNCIEAFYLNKKTYQEIAHEQQIELKKVKSAIQNGKRNLKNCIEQQK